MLSNALTEMISTKVMFLLALNILLLFLGMIMDAGPIILIIAPIIYPVALSFGIDPIQLGCIIVFNSLWARQPRPLAYAFLPRNQSPGKVLRPSAENLCHSY